MLLGFGLVILAIIIFSAFLLAQSYDIRKLSIAISTIDTPTVQASTKMSNAVNSALAALRGWVLFSEDEQKKRLKIAWISIREAEREMQDLSRNWTDVDNLSRFNLIKTLLNQFEFLQFKTENVANTAYNTPASNILFTIAAPLAESMSTHIAKMIDLEHNQRATNKRKELLLAMSDIRGAHGHELANTRAYILSANDKYKSAFYRYRKENDRAFLRLLRIKNLLTSEQKSHLNEFSTLRNKFKNLSPRMFKIREQPDWNRANYLLRTQVAPLGNKITTFLSELIEKQNVTLVNAGSSITKHSQNHINELIFLSIIVTAIAVYIGSLISRRIANPLIRAVSVAKEVSAGKFGLILSDRDKSDTSEVGELLTALETMSNNLLTQQQNLAESHSKIIESNKLAAIGAMAANIAHEINSPLQTISIYTYKIKNNKNESQSPHNDEWVDNIDKAVDNVSAIIESLSKLSRNTSSDKFKKVKVADIINDVTELNKEREILSDVKLDITFYDGCNDATIYGHYTALCQIITNLLNNAYDAVSDLNETWISIEVHDVMENIVISITDSGKGIPTDIQDKIFQAMFTSKDIGKGTGIGLSISAEIARQHNGQLVLNSEYKNTRFILTIPKYQTMKKVN